MTETTDTTVTTDTTPTKVKLVVLDMAGTTVHDGGLVELAFEAAASELGVEPGSERHDAMLADVRATMGESKITVFRRLFGEEELAQRANVAFEAAYERMVGEGHVVAIPGAEDAIKQLRAAGVAVVLTTGFSGPTQQAIIAALGWENLVDLALCPADAGRGRPYPDLALAAFLRTAAADSVAEMAVIGDTGYDMQCGVRSGASVVAGVLTGAHLAERLRADGATVVLNSVADLPALVL
ncbi:phosphonatase-like hydrolase [Streptacidiphilus fuscans]|uniref:Phosphonatase-like hydrolase n=1 Tax=Streptacidiphilus fuscans TaxID=2789292 RepID=A0A931BBV3_9ACTN|nr:phosphonatase-like hydrolase [Streptacidiphilus fuscans]MBF9072402.1 phosphonatase-like hydrolase [Streptacidiphilus fuscans]